MLTGRRIFVWEGAPKVVLGPHSGKHLSTLAKLTSVGIEFSLSVLLGLLGGRWVDEKLGTSPWLMIVGLLLGVSAALRSLIRTARQANHESQSRPRDAGDGHGNDTDD
jgi:F0F1-type ATP synthase assembly protein I